MKKKRNGFSLTEVIISMSLIVLISAVGFLACLLANRIGAESEYELKGYMDAEKMRLCLDSAYDAIKGDSEKKDEYVRVFMERAEWYFETKGLANQVLSQEKSGADWTVELSVGNKQGESCRSLSVYYYGVQNGLASYAYAVTVADEGHSVRCVLNCRTAVFSATVTATKNNASLAFYERSYQYGR